MDIDGVISLFGFDPLRPPAGSLHSIDGIVHFLSAGAGRNLLALLSSFDAVWCSGWEEKANEYLPHLLGLPGPLPYVRFPAGPRTTAAHWKLSAVDAFAGPRPLAWIDDAFNQACEDWARARAAPTLLTSTMPARGLTTAEAGQLLEWRAALSDGRAGASQRA